MTRFIAVLFTVCTFALGSDVFAQSVVGELKVDDVQKKVRIAFNKDKTGLVLTQLPRYKAEIQYAEIDSAKFVYLTQGFDPGTAILGGWAIGLMKKGEKLPLIMLYVNNKVYYLTKFHREKEAQRFWVTYFTHRAKIKLIDGENWEVEKSEK